VCYVLNRVPPKYITSGRGILHLELESEVNTQRIVDIYAIIKEALQIISSRRREDDDKKLLEDDFFFSENIIQTKDYYVNFPYFTGRVLKHDQSDLKEDVEVSLYIKTDKSFKLAEMISLNWKNPFITNKNTYGYYTFWVNPMVSREQEGPEEEIVTFKFVYETEKKEPIEKIVDIRVYTEKAKHFSIRTGFSIRIEDTLIDIYE
jgi:competence protein ComFB